MTAATHVYPISLSPSPTAPASLSRAHAQAHTHKRDEFASSFLVSLCPHHASLCVRVCSRENSLFLVLSQRFLSPSLASFLHLLPLLPVPAVARCCCLATHGTRAGKRSEGKVLSAAFFCASCMPACSSHLLWSHHCDWRVIIHCRLRHHLLSTPTALPPATPQLLASSSSSSAVVTSLSPPACFADERKEVHTASLFP